MLAIISYIIPDIPLVSQYFFLKIIKYGRYIFRLIDILTYLLACLKHLEMNLDMNASHFLILNVILGMLLESGQS